YDPTNGRPPYALLLNRMSPSAPQRGRAHAVFYTLQYLDFLERLGVPVVNGRAAYEVEISKARQLSLLRELDLPFPPARVIHDAADAASAADGLRYPVVVKPNIGGSGAGVRRFETRDQLEAAARDGVLDLGVDHTALVQEFVPQADGRIVRVEVLGGRYLYGIRVYSSGETFNLCPADVCQTVGGAELERSACALDAPRNGLRVEAYSPPADVIRDVERIAQRAAIDVGGIEYMIDERDGRLLYYDVNALSNFVADAPRVIGFDPFARLVDYLLERGS
ncbi:MAG: ATP-grasp domain-containing protein, partial [Longimicrobiales bacterium]